MSSRIGPEPKELLAAADELLATPIDSMAGRWPRAVALLTRQAIEGTLFDLWRAVSPGVEAAPMRAQLLVLRQSIAPPVAAETESVWAALSRACHHHPSTQLTNWSGKSAADSRHGVAGEPPDARTRTEAGWAPVRWK